jgi:hypothetical protein
MFRIFSLLLVVTACGADVRSGSGSPGEAPSAPALTVAGEIDSEEQQISFRVAGFVKSMGIT